MEQTARLTALAGLLHDIGKIAYRAGVGKQSHSVLGRDLLATYLPAGEEYRALLDCVACHHASQLHRLKRADHPAYLIYEADNIAAGADRRSEGEDSGFDMSAPLESVFVRLKGTTDKHAHFLRGLGENDKINYPTPISAVAATSDKYKLLLNVLEGNLKQTDFATSSINEVLKIMEAVASYIPASTNKGEACDISLYDHSRLTAALAAAMEQYFAANGICDFHAWCAGEKNADFRIADAFLLAEGDMSGIQSFIYTIPSAGALKSLRGRSFYLELLLEHIADELLDATGLSRANLLFTGGGHFRLLGANTQAMRDLLADAQNKLNAWLLEHFGVSLYLQLAWQPCSAHDLMNKQPDKLFNENRTGKLARDLSGSLATGKLRRYSPDQLTELFSPQSRLNKTPDSTRECAVCHSSSASLTETKDGLRCSQCQGLFELGEQLLKGGEVVAVTHAVNGLSLPALAGKPLTLKLFSPRQAEQEATLLRIYVKNKMETGSLLATHLWVGDYAARRHDQTTLDFETLAAASSGSKRLAVLRADLDSLGEAFIGGFEQPGAERYKYATLSRYASLSRQLSLFFKSHINTICQGKLSGDDGIKRQPYDLWGRSISSRQAAIVYSGGDDLFIVGAWDHIIGLAIDLRQSFHSYSLGKLTLSAGIALFPDSYPVTQMAEITGQLEAAAKASPGKNSIALFGMDKSVVNEKSMLGCRYVYDWDRFIKSVTGEKLAFLRSTLDFEDKNAQVGATGKLKAGKSLLYKLLQLVDTAGNPQESFKLVPLVYLLARLEPAKEAHELTRRCYQEFRNNLYQWYCQDTDRHELAAALRLLIYGLRSQTEEQEG